MWNACSTKAEGPVNSIARPLGWNLIDGEAERGQPVAHRSQIFRRGTELGAESLRREPLLVTGGSRIVLVGDELLEGRLLVRATLQLENDVLHLHVGGNPADFIFLNRQRVSCARQSD